jgi:hypothetical protein
LVSFWAWQLKEFSPVEAWVKVKDKGSWLAQTEREREREKAVIVLIGPPLSDLLLCLE